MDANKIACSLLWNTNDPQYGESIRHFQGCPTVAVTKGGRVYAGWYSGGPREPHMDNYCILTYSDDGGKTVKKPLLIIPSDKERMIHALDIQLWVAPNGRLFVFWIQEDVVPTTKENLARTDFPCIENFTGFARIDGFMFVDFAHATWCITCDNPDDDTPVFSEPRCLCPGFLRNKPLAITEKKWLLPAYDQITWNYGYSLTEDGGETFTHSYGGKKVSTRFDEGMAYVRADGSIRLLTRTSTGVVAESISKDGAKTFPNGVPTDIPNPDSRFFISRTPSGRLLMIGNDHRKERTAMTFYLSEDDGATWFARQTFDTRSQLSYPDADFHGGRIYFTYDRERTGVMEIILGTTTEEAVISGAAPVLHVISKP